jgi:M6 family metalloprotease-like protein
MSVPARMRRGPLVAVSLVLACILGVGIARAGIYPNPVPDFAHPGTPHRPLLSPAGGDLDRPVLVIYLRYSDAGFAQGQDAAFMANRFFGPFPSVVNYYSATSNGKLVLSPAAETNTIAGGAANDGVAAVGVGMTQSAFDAQNADQQTKQALQAADADVNFAAFDANNDGKVTESELLVAVVKVPPANSSRCGANFGNAAVSLDGKTIDYGPNIGGHIPLVDADANLITQIHELAHASLAFPDFYTVGVGQLDLMGGAQCSGDDSRLWELSSWSKMHLGWIKPTVVTSDGYYNVSRYDTTGDSFLLYDPGKNTDNYFLVENREPTASTYDQTVGDRGLVVWRVDDAQFANNAVKWIEAMRPDGQSNVTDDGRDAWNPSDPNTPQRTMARAWRDGTASNVAVRAIGGGGDVMRAYFDVRGPGVLVDTYDQLKQGPATVTLGQAGSLSFPVMNTGEAADAFVFTVTIPAGWTASADTQTLGAGVGSTATVQVTPPLNAATGVYTLNATGRSVNDSSITSSSPVQVLVVRRPTTLVYTGDVTADYHDPATLSATLTDTISGQPLAGMNLDFVLGTQQTSGTTDGSGIASASVVVDQKPGSVFVGAGFAGDATYRPSAASTTFTITREETTTTYTGPTVILQGGSGVMLEATLLEDGTTPPVPSGQALTLSLGGQSCTGTVDSTGTAQCSLTFGGALGPQPLKADFAGDDYYLPSSDTSKTAVVFAFPSQGAFVLGDTTVAGAGSTTNVSWWGEDWARRNALSGGPAPVSFKGFADSVASLPTVSPPAMCGVSWTSSGGNSPPPTADVPSYMGVLVAGTVGKSGSTIAGSFARIVVVKTGPGYAPSPGHAGIGTIVATFCP